MPDTDVPDPVVSVRSSAVVHAPPLPLSPPPARPRDRVTVCVFAAVALGVALRLLAFSADRSLWIDEAMLALNVVERTPAGLLEPLAHNQGAPVGFLLLTKLAVAVFGPTESAFRLVPLLGSAGGLAAFAVVARRLLPGGAAAVAVLLFAVSPSLIGYAGEAKQYSTDVAIAVGLLAMSAGPRRWPLAVGGAVAVWFSHPAAFVLAGLGCALLGRELLRRDRRAALATLGMIAVWLVSFAAVYLLSVRHLGGNRYLADYWDEAFLPLAPHGLKWLADKARAVAALCGWADGPYSGAAGPAVLLVIGGAVALWRERRAELAAMCGVVGFTLTASALHKYPFAGRLLLFLVPLVLLLVARGVWAGVERLAGWWKPLAVALLAVAVAVPLGEGVRQFGTPPRREQLRPVLAHLRQQWQPGDRVYVYGGEGDAGAGPAFRFYTRTDPFPADAVVLGKVCRDDPAGYRDDVKAISGPGRVWVLFSHRHADEEATIRGHFDEIGDRGAEFHADGAAAYEYRLR